MTRTIPVGSEPTQLTISDDGTQTFVGLDGADAVRQVDLTTGVAGLQFSLGSGGGIYGTPFIPEAVAALPGEPNSVAVYNSSAVVTIYDSGTARPNTAPLNGYFNQNTGAITFGPSAATLYTTQSPLVGDDFGVLTIDSTGVSAINGLPSPLPYPYSGSLQFDAGRLYLSNGAVLNDDRRPTWPIFLESLDPGYRPHRLRLRVAEGLDGPCRPDTFFFAFQPGAGV
jgi:trimeric autotransporter adhesin